MQDKLEKRSQSPLYKQLMLRLKNDITAGVYPAGGRIPSEQVLCDVYGVSRVTVRKALLDLVQEGMLVRRQGKGTFVADERIQRDLHQITSFSEACRQMGHQPGTRIISVQMHRLRLCDGEPVMLEINHFPQQYESLLTQDVSGSLYAVLRKLGAVPTSATHDISLGHATPMVSRYLSTEPGEALLLLDELVLDQHGQPLHLSRQWIRGDRYTFRI